MRQGCVSGSVTSITTRPVFSSCQYGIERLRVGQVMVFISGYNPVACNVRTSWDGNGNIFPATAS